MPGLAKDWAEKKKKLKRGEGGPLASINSPAFGPRPRVGRKVILLFSTYAGPGPNQTQRVFENPCLGCQRNMSFSPTRTVPSPPKRPRFNWMSNLEESSPIPSSRSTTNVELLTCTRYCRGCANGTCGLPPAPTSPARPRLLYTMEITRQPGTSAPVISK